MTIALKQRQEKSNAEVGSDLMTVAEAANFLRLKESTIRAWILRRQIPYLKVGGKRVLFRRADLEGLIEKSLILPAPQSNGSMQKKAA